MNIFNEVRDVLETVIASLQEAEILPGDIDTSRITVEPPRDLSHGDMATNAAMLLSKPAKMKPRDLAEKIVEKLDANDLIVKAEIAGPGFINMTLDASSYWSVAHAILEAGNDFGRSDMGGNQPINIEYVSANPTGPMHVGHARGAVVGDALASLLEKAGYDVTREYYINDAGAQVDVLARSAYLRYCEALGDDINNIPEGLYPGQYLIPVGQALADKYGDSLKGKDEDAWLSDVREFALAAMMALIKEDLALLGVKHDIFSSEKALVDSGRVEEVLETLKSNDNVYVGVLEPPKGKKPDDWEERPQTLFRATNWGDDIDRPLQKSNGSFTYFASDIAYHLDKYQRGIERMINIFGADHGGYVKRMVAATRAVSDDNAHLDIKLCQLVKLMDNGEPLKMSKRAGTFVTLRDLVEDVGKDVVRFFMLTRKNDAPLDFDLSVVREQSRDNPVFYVQYAHARCHSVLKMAQDAFPDEDFGPDAFSKDDLALLGDDAHLSALKLLSGMPRMIEAAAEAHEPHRVAFYLQDVAAEFHGLWNKGKEASHLRFVHADNRALTRAHMALIRCFQMVIASGLDIFGVEPVQELH